MLSQDAGLWRYYLKHGKLDHSATRDGFQFKCFGLFTIDIQQCWTSEYRKRLFTVWFSNGPTIQTLDFYFSFKLHHLVIRRLWAIWKLDLSGIQIPTVLLFKFSYLENLNLLFSWRDWILCHRVDNCWLPSRPSTWPHFHFRSRGHAPRAMSQPKK